MKKILLIPTTLIAAITPIIATTSCNNPDTPTPDPEVTKYHFEFTGNNCRINEHDHLSVDIEENTKVEYTVLPNDGFKLSETQDLPDGVTLSGNLLTIAKMDKAYEVTINAETVEPLITSLVILGLDETYEGIIGEEGHTSKVTINLIMFEESFDVTDYVTFNITGPLSWNPTEKWFSWSNKLDISNYDCDIQANYHDVTTSDLYSTHVNIGPRTPFIKCEGIEQRYDVSAYQSGSVGPATILYYSADKLEPDDVTNDIKITSISEEFVHWDASTKCFRWDYIESGYWPIDVFIEYDEPTPFIEIMLTFWLNAQ